MKQPRRRHQLLALLGVVLVIAGCTPGTNESQALNNPAVIAPYLQGLSETQAKDYRDEWFPKSAEGDALGWVDLTSIAGPGGDAPPPEKPLINPDCPLDFAYEMSVGGYTKPGADLARLSDSLEIPAASFNTARQEVLFFLRGSKLKPSATGRANCADPSSADGVDFAYLPVRIRINGQKPVWIIEGFTNPVATIDISVDAGPDPVKLTGDLNRYADEIKAVYALPRMRRLVLTDENYGRVLSYAKVGAEDGPARRLIWLRLSDVAPYYRWLSGQAGGGGCTAPVLAFWENSAHLNGNGNNDNGIAGSQATFSPNPACAKTDLVWPAGDESKGESDRARGSAWIDTQGRYVAAVKSDGSNNDDNSCSEFGCVPISNESWERALPFLYTLSATVSPRGKDANAAVRTAALKGLYDELVKSNARDANRVPAELGGDGGENGTYTILPDVFPVLASGGPEAWKDLQEGYSRGGDALRATIGYTGRADGTEWDPTTSRADPVTITPTYRTVANDENWYTKNSLLFGKGDFINGSAVFSTGDANRSGGAVEIPVRRSPVARIRITITDTIRQQVNSTYSSNWIPLYAIGGHWGNRVDLDACGFLAILCYVRRAADWLIDTVLGNTLGAVMGALSKGTTGNLLAIPSLEEYEIAQVTNGTVRYRVYDEIGQAALEGKSAEEAAKAHPNIPLECFVGSAAIVDNNIDQWGKCYKPNGMYGLYSMARGLALVLLLVYVARFFLTLMTGRERDMNITSFFTRAAISAAMILFLGSILRLMGMVVAETVLLTNAIGSAITGQTYSHLWLFQLYANPPSGIGALVGYISFTAAILGMFVLSIFSFLRLGMTTVMIVLSPLWVIDLMRSRTPDFFYKSLFWVIRLWIMPMIMLTLILSFFLVIRLAGDFLGGFLGAMLMTIGLIVLVLLTWRLSAAVMKKTSEGIKARIQGALEQKGASELDNMVTAGLAGGSTGGGGGGRSGAALGKGGGGSSGNKRLLDRARGKGGKGAAGAKGKGGKGAASSGGMLSRLRPSRETMLDLVMGPGVATPSKCPGCGTNWKTSKFDDSPKTETLGNGDIKCLKCGHIHGMSRKSAIANTGRRVITGGVRAAAGKMLGTGNVSLFEAALGRRRERSEKSGKKSSGGIEAISVLTGSGGALATAAGNAKRFTALREVRENEEERMSTWRVGQWREAVGNSRQWAEQAAAASRTQGERRAALGETRAAVPESVSGFHAEAAGWRARHAEALGARNSAVEGAVRDLGGSASTPEAGEAWLQEQAAAARSELAEKRASAERFGVDPNTYAADAQARLNRLEGAMGTVQGARQSYQEVRAARPSRPSDEEASAWYGNRNGLRRELGESAGRLADANQQRREWGAEARRLNPVSSVTERLGLRRGGSPESL